MHLLTFDLEFAIICGMTQKKAKLLRIGEMAEPYSELYWNYVYETVFQETS